MPRSVALARKSRKAHEPEDVIRELKKANQVLLAAPRVEEASTVEFLQKCIKAARSSDSAKDLAWLSAAARFWSQLLFFRTGRDITPFIYSARSLGRRSTVSRRSSVNVVLLGDRIVVRQSRLGEGRASGLVIPDTAQEKLQLGDVIAVGPGRLDDNNKRIPVDVKAGDKVLYSKYSGQDVPKGIFDDAEDYIVLKESDILTMLRPRASHS